MGRKREFTIDRAGRPRELTVVGNTGEVHKHGDNITKEGKDGHFADEGKYRRAIEKAVKENKKAK